MLRLCITNVWTFQHGHPGSLRALQKKPGSNNTKCSYEAHFLDFKNDKVHKKTVNSSVFHHAPFANACLHEISLYVIFEKGVCDFVCMHSCMYKFHLSVGPSVRRPPVRPPDRPQPYGYVVPNMVSMVHFIYGLTTVIFCDILLAILKIVHLSRIVTKPTKWHVHPAKTHISLGMHPV